MVASAIFVVVFIGLRAAWRNAGFDRRRSGAFLCAACKCTGQDGNQTALLHLWFHALHDRLCNEP
jgi:hypothetical protein